MGPVMADASETRRLLQLLMAGLLPVMEGGEEKKPSRSAGASLRACARSEPSIFATRLAFLPFRTGLVGSLPGVMRKMPPSVTCSW